MSRLIDADALERDGWQMSRTVQIDKNTMEFQTRKPTDFPTVEPQRMRGRWIDKSEGRIEGAWPYCSVCDDMSVERFDFCPNCGADMRGGQDD